MMIISPRSVAVGAATKSGSDIGEILHLRWILPRITNLPGRNGAVLRNMILDVLSVLSGAFVPGNPFVPGSSVLLPGSSLLLPKTFIRISAFLLPLVDLLERHLEDSAFDGRGSVDHFRRRART